ncbi:TadE/TadG family type IV pilus assembly protein [Sphingomonas sp. GB1N7]|uniref:TadE/TadG family type IV pilus assembly protein n=1 Tax=Parasphingomonas caseinilytica TaxID=3096158 RepID=UPI002FCC966E
MRRRHLPRRLKHDERGATIIEFAIVAPVLMTLIMGLSEMTYQEYLQVQLNGAVQKAARDSAIQGGAGNAATIDAKVITLVGAITKTMTQSCATSPAASTWCSTRKSYSQFGTIKPEYIYDTNSNGVLDPGECFDDVNANNNWDADPGAAGQGGANDVAMYTMSITYPRMFPVVSFLGWSDRQTLSSTTILKNQPYANQATPAVKKVCP